MWSLLTALLATTSLALPLNPNSPSKRDDTTTQYLLRTQLVNGPTRFNDLYVESYHTGAGLSDATLSPSTEYAVKGFLNSTSTEWQIDLGNPFPWGLIMYGDTNYAAWDPVLINAGGGSVGFYFDEGAAPGLLWNGGLLNSNQSYAQGEFQDWVVCDWWHGSPQVCLSELVGEKCD